jgi:hypothetical protein
LHIDSDEVLDEEAITTIRQTLSDPQQGEAFLIRRRTYFMGKHLRFGGTVTWHLRLFRSGTAQCEDRLYDQHFVSPLPASKLVRGALHDMNIGNLTEWTSRHNHWSDLEAREILKGDEADPSGQLQASISGDPRERTRFLKGLYYRGPLLWRAGLYFFYRYILRGGFLDGRTGFIFNFLQAFWFRILIDAKIVELRLRESQPQERP